MFDHMDGVMHALAKTMTPWKEDLFFAMKLSRQKLSKYYAEVTPKKGMLLISAHILQPFRKLQSWESGTREWISILRTRHPILPNTKKLVWSMWRMNSVPNIDVCRSINTKANRAAIPSPLQRLLDPVNHPLIHIIWAAMMKNTWPQTMWLRQHPDQAIAQHAN